MIFIYDIHWNLWAGRLCYENETTVLFLGCINAMKTEAGEYEDE